MRGLILIGAALLCGSCSYHARNSDYHGSLRRKTSKMLSVDFVDMIVEQEGEDIEDFVALSKEKARLCEEKKSGENFKRVKNKNYMVTKNDQGDWIYIQE